MIDIFQLYQSLQNEVNTWQGGHIKPAQNFIRWVNSVSKEMYQEKCKNLGNNQKDTDDIANFLVSANMVIEKLTGKPYDQIKYPTNPAFGHYSSCRIMLYNQTGCAGSDNICIDGSTGNQCASGDCDKYQDPDMLALEQMEAEKAITEGAVKMIPNQNWAAAISHARKVPTPNKPVITQYDGGFKIAPKGLGIVVMDYYRLPVDAVFAYTVGPDDEIIYDAANSTQLDWLPTLIPEFIARLKKKYGVYVADESMYATGDKEQKEIN